MKKLFKDILNMNDVKGVMLFSFTGELLFKEFVSPLSEEPEKKDWWRLFFLSLNKVNEAELVFEKSRLYIRKTELGFLMILMGCFAPVAMVRLNCDILIPALKQTTTMSGLKRFFMKNIL